MMDIHDPFDPTQEGDLMADDFGYEALGEGLYEDELDGLDEFGLGLYEERARPAVVPARPAVPPRVAANVAVRVARATGGAPAAKAVVKAIKNPAAAARLDFDGFDGFDGEASLAPQGAAAALYEEMMMLADHAARAANPADADAFLGSIGRIAGPLVSSLFQEAEEEAVVGADGEGDEFLPLIAAALPAVASALPAVAKIASPLVKRGLGMAGRLLGGLGRSSAGRGAARALPRAALNTGQSLINQARAGRPITAAGVGYTLGNNLYRQLCAPPMPGGYYSPAAAAAARRRAYAMRQPY